MITTSTHQPALFVFYVLRTKTQADRDGRPIPPNDIGQWKLWINTEKSPMSLNLIVHNALRTAGYENAGALTETLSISIFYFNHPTPTTPATLPHTVDYITYDIFPKR